MKRIFIIYLIGFLTMPVLIDIFGNGKSIYKIDKLPNTITNNNGTWERSKGGEGIAYLLIEPSQEYIEGLVLDMEKQNQIDIEAEVRANEIPKAIKDLKKRILAIEEK